MHFRAASFVLATASYVVPGMGLDTELLPDASITLMDDMIEASFMEAQGTNSGNFSIALSPESLFGLDKRQSRCPDSCGDGRCCQTGYRCVSGGCCKGSSIKCGVDTCYDPASEVCCKSTGGSCPKGYDCVSGGCCRSGLKPCGDKCYDPDTQQCCENGACPKSDKCCGNKCCKDIAYCASGNQCELCPASTRTVTTTYSSTFTSIVTRTISRPPAQDEEQPEFSCVPMTATNADGATLELGDDCALNYEPPSSTASEPDSTGTSEASNQKRHAEEGLILSARQAGCTPHTTYTSTSTRTVRVTASSTTSRTVTVEPSDEGFSCPEMAATNAAGDELALNEACELEFKPAEPTETSGPADSGGSGDDGGSQDDSAPTSVQATISIFWYTAFFGVIGLVVENI